MKIASRSKKRTREHPDGWVEEAKRMNQIAKKDKEEILARLEACEKENKDEELELEKKEAKETEARWKDDTRNASP